MITNINSQIPIDICCLDLETTGLDENVHEIVEIAAIRGKITNGKLNISKKFNVKILPTKPVNPKVAKYNGYNEETWKQAPNLTSLANGVGGLVDMMEGAWHIGSNPDYDRRFLTKAFKKLNWVYPTVKSHHVLDVPMLYFDLYLSGKVEKIQQEIISNYLGFKPYEAHRALSDTYRCLELFAHKYEYEIIDPENDT